MDSILDLGGSLLHEAKVSFVDQCSALESVVWALLSKVVLSDAAQFLVDQRDEDLEGILVTGSPFGQQGADRLRRWLGHAHMLAISGNEVTGQQSSAMRVGSQSSVTRNHTPAVANYL
jgi:hypothetical protein